MDLKGQITQNLPNTSKNEDFIKDNNSHSYLLLNDNEFVRLCKKTERLASAVYLMTDFFPDKEPLKWALRRWVLKIISETLSLKQAYSSKERKERIFNKVLLIDIQKVSSLLETAYLGGLTSEMNHSVLSGELSNLARMGQSYIGSSLRSEDREGNLKDSHFSPDSYETDYKGQNNKRTDMSYKNVFYKKSDTSIKDKISQDRNKKSFLDKERKQKEGSEKKNQRQVKIIDIVKDKKEVSIKDITEVIRDCSEKTIQRELNSMVASGVLKKHGKRRWSRYSLNL